jgi:hypothetical protein
LYELKVSVATDPPWATVKPFHSVALVKVTMAAEAAWVITTAIAAADKAIRIDIEETPNKGRKGSTDGKQLRKHANPSRRRVSARQGGRAPFQHLQTD